MDQDIKSMQLNVARGIRTKSSMLEGVFRSLFQACTQNDLVANIELYRMMMNSADMLMYDIESLIKQHAALVASPAEQEGTNAANQIERAVN